MLVYFLFTQNKSDYYSSFQLLVSSHKAIKCLIGQAKKTDNFLPLFYLLGCYQIN